MKVKTDTIIRTIVLVVALINQTLIMSGKNPLPWGDDQVYSAASAVLTVAASIWAWWKNNSFTHNAKEADTYLESLKDGEME